SRSCCQIVMVTIFNLNGVQCQDNIHIVACIVWSTSVKIGGLYAYNCEDGAAVRSDARSCGTWVRAWFPGRVPVAADRDLVGAVPRAPGTAGARRLAAQGYRRGARWRGAGVRPSGLGGGGGHEAS